MRERERDGEGERDREREGALKYIIWGEKWGGWSVLWDRTELECRGLYSWVGGGWSVLWARIELECRVLYSWVGADRAFYGLEQSRSVEFYFLGLGWMECSMG